MGEAFAEARGAERGERLVRVSVARREAAGLELESHGSCAAADEVAVLGGRRRRIGGDVGVSGGMGGEGEGERTASRE